MVNELADRKGELVRFCPECEVIVNTDILITPVSGAAELCPRRSLRLTAAESDAFFRMIVTCQSIRCHRELLLWLTGELQEFLPHEILISACGDFATWRLQLDIVSTLHSARTALLAQCNIDDLLHNLHSGWVEHGRRPLVLRLDDPLVRPLRQCACSLHRALREMHTVLVHGARNARDQHDSLYVAFHRASFTRGQPRDRFMMLLDLLIPQFDIGFSRVKPLSLAARDDDQRGRSAWLNLSAREQEILEFVCRGESNQAIARLLEISRFTVKNHVQRIYRKIGVSNRTQAATTYNRVFRELKGAIARSDV
jgi:transcriptional regulator EpsA